MLFRSICSQLGITATGQTIPGDYVNSRVTVSWSGLQLTNTTYSVQLYNGSGAPYGSPSPPLPSTVTSWQSPPVPGNVPYYATITVCQNSSSFGIKCAPACSSGYVTPPVTPTPPVFPTP